VERAHGGHWWPQEFQARKETLRRAQTAWAHQRERLTAAYLREVIPLAEYQRRRQDLEQQQHAVAAQAAQREAQGDRQGKLAGMVPAMEEFCQRVRSGWAAAPCAQQRTLVELLLDRVLVDNGDVEIRYVIPTSPHGETTRFYQLRKDYFEVPLVPWLGASTLQLMRVVLPKLQTPLAEGLMGHVDAALEQEFLHVAV
jgi:site-specific DNA recombinase